MSKWGPKPITSAKPGFKPPEERCCPRCLNLMRLVDGVYECAKHGAPPPDKVTVKAR